MTIYKQGAQGQGVLDIQKALIGLGYDPGPADGAFGPKTMAAVAAFQKDKGLSADGVVGPATSSALMSEGDKLAPASPPSPPSFSPPPQAASPLRERCVGLTGSFETSTPVPQCFSGLTGNFDGQGISFGALQQNFGQGSLQPLLQRMIAGHEAVIAGIFGPDFVELQGVLALARAADQVAWAAGKQTPKYNVNPPWKGYFIALGQTPEYQAIQSDAAAGVYNKGLGYCRQFGLKSERAAALMFDIVTQNGSISPAVAAQINADFAKLPADPTDETPKLAIVANRRAEDSRAAYVEDVRTRKLTIANGQGTVHGMKYDLAKSYGITLDPAADLA